MIFWIFLSSMGFLLKRIHTYSMVTLWIEDLFLWKSSSLCLHSSACLLQVNPRSLPVCKLYYNWTHFEFGCLSWFVRIKIFWWWSKYTSLPLCVLLKLCLINCSILYCCFSCIVYSFFFFFVIGLEWILLYSIPQFNLQAIIYSSLRMSTYFLVM